MSDWPGLSGKQSAFLTALVIQGGHKTKAAKAAKVSRALVYRWLKEPVYKEQFDLAIVQAFGVLEDAAIVRGKDGVKRAVYYKGKKVGYEVLYSDALMMMFLRAGDAKYRAPTEVTGKDGGPIESRIEVVFVTREKPKP